MKKGDRRGGRLFGKVRPSHSENGFSGKFAEAREPRGLLKVRLEARNLRVQQYLPAFRHSRKADSICCKQKTMVGKSGK